MITDNDSNYNDKDNIKKKKIEQKVQKQITQAN